MKKEYSFEEAVEYGTSFLFWMLFFSIVNMFFLSYMFIDDVILNTCESKLVVLYTSAYLISMVIPVFISISAIHLLRTMRKNTIQP